MKYILLLLCSSFLVANEIGFDEWFNLQQNRQESLKELIPGTEEYYYYHALYYQQQKQYDKVKETLTQWIEKYGTTSQVREIENRQALFDYEKNPQQTLQYIVEKLGISFDHQQQQITAKTQYPSSLDQKLIATETLRSEAFEKRRYYDIESSSWEFFVNENLSPDARRHMLKKLMYPDHERLPGLIVEDLEYRYSRGFGSLKIHNNLLLKQLDECLKRMPRLINDNKFVHTYLQKLYPNADSNWQQDDNKRTNYIYKLWKFVKKLPATQNSLKAHILYNYLLLNLRSGKYPKALFMHYIKLPRDVGYINEEFWENAKDRADITANYAQYTGLENIDDDDEGVVREYLLHFFKTADNYDEYSPYISEQQLKEFFVESKIVNAIGDKDQWYSMLSPEDYQRLTARIDLEFTKSNAQHFAANDSVKLNIAVKNIKDLIVKTYSIHTKNYYTKHNEEVTTAIDIDGLVANHEQVLNYNHEAQIRHIETLNLTHIDKPGVYIVECIGNGKSSRAVVRKGNLFCVERVGAAGHVFSVYDNNNSLLKTAQIHYGNRLFSADENGEITIPFTKRSAQQKYIVSHDNFAMLKTFEHLAEDYQFSAGIYIDREQLLRQKSCQIIIRPRLYVNDNPISISLLEDASLQIETTNRDGVHNTQEIKDFKLSDDAEATYTFKVPEKLQKITVTVSGKVENISKGSKDNLSRSISHEINSIDATHNIEDLFLQRVGEKYVLRALGKTGELREKRIVKLQCKHRHFKNTIEVTLQTDDRGQIDLGALRDIERIAVYGADKVPYFWYLHNEQRSYPDTLHIAAGEKLSLPILDTSSQVHDVCALLELRSGTFVSDESDKVSLKNSFLQIEKLSAGDYLLWLKKAQQRITIRVAKGKKNNHALLSKKRYLQLRNRNPLHIANISEQDGKLRVQLHNHQANTRVHIIATHFVPQANIYSQFANIHSVAPQSQELQFPVSIYLSGRQIGDEYRYILNRKYAKKYPGNNLARPSLLLNPWSLRDTQTSQQTAASGDKWGRMNQPLYGSRNGGRVTSGTVGLQKRSHNTYSNFDFLQNTSLVLSNLKPDKNGVVELAISTIQPRQHIQIIAVDHDDVVYREWGLAHDKDQFQDMRLANAFTSKAHFAERKDTSTVLNGRLFHIDDITTSKVEVYDSLKKVHTLFSVLTKNQHLQNFDFILRWPQLEMKEKNRLYSQHVCHELNFFLYKKDREYFGKVVKPYLQNKQHKTFIDQWLLGENLQQYLEPWSFNRLNIIERILLGQRRNGQNIFRHVNDVNLLRNVNADELNRRYRTAIQLSSLATKDDLGLNNALDKVSKSKPLPKTTTEAYDEEKESEESLDEDDYGDEAAGDDFGGDAGGDEWGDGFGGDAGGDEWGDDSGEAMDGASKDDFDGKDIRAERKRDAKRRKQIRPFYQGTEKTKEWVENNYYQRKIEEQIASLIHVNGFWRDYAAHSEGPFLSANFIEATQNFSEMMFALAVLDLPFTANKHQVEYTKEKMTLSPGNSVIVFHQQIQETPVKNENSILTRQRFFAYNSRYMYVNNERIEKFVEGEFQVGQVYGSQIIITNPTSQKRKINVLMQIPQGAIPLKNGFVTESRYYELGAYTTKAIEYYFYFPLPGDFTIYPVQISENETIIAYENVTKFNVVKVLSQQDTSSWEYISQYATPDEVIRYLQTENLARINLQLIAFRMKDAVFFSRALTVLQQRQAYEHTLWSYALLHNDPQVVRQYLPNTSYANSCGAYIQSPLLDVDPIIRHSYQHREYWPLVHPRVNQLGGKRQILNQQFFTQYQEFMRYMRYRANLSDEDLLSCVVYLLLQDRVSDAIAIMSRIDRKNLHTQIQYDYLQSYMAFYLEKPQEAKEIAGKYVDYPVERWRVFFSDVVAQVDELENSSKPQKSEDNKQDVVKSSEDFDFVIEQQQIQLQYHNVENCQVNYYPMDLELLFSRNPFVKSTADQFSIVHPHSSEQISLDKKQQQISHALPQKYIEKNVLVEVVCEGKTKSQAYYPHNLNLHIAQNYGQLQVRESGSNKMLKKVYVKVYAKYNDGTVQFYKDGYTDLRGRFDYASLSTDDLDRVQMFSILILSEKHGAIVREVQPPKM